MEKRNERERERERERRDKKIENEITKLVQ